MSGRPTISLVRRGVGLLFLCSFILAIGCSTPQQRYKVLSVFFDGVPNPDAPRRVSMVFSTNEPQVIHAMTISRHKPFVDGKCATCHTSARGEIEEFDKAYLKCVQCHKTATTSRPRMHGPVASAACQWCHTAHESSEPALLKDAPIKVCTQCHDQQLLGNKPPEHNDGKTSCVKCHFGHGGSDQFYLKPATTTAPAPIHAATTIPSPATAPMPERRGPQ